MSTQSEITRLTTARNTIRNKMVNLGLGVSTDTLDTLATEVDSIVNRGAVAAEVKEGEIYTIPAGYHSGAGTVTGVAGGGSYTLQAKSTIPTKSQQAITPDSGYYGLSSVTVAAIPAAYQDVSAVTAAAADVLTTKVFVASDGTVTAGTMTNNGAVSQTLQAGASYTVPAGYHNGEGTVAAASLASQTVGDAVAANILADKVAWVNGASVTGTMVNRGTVTQTLDTTTTSYTIPAGYHNGSGAVSLVLETKNATPGTTSQDITPTEGKVLSKVTVAAIDAKYADTTDATAVAANILYGATAYGNVDGAATKLTGTMVNRGAVAATLTGLGAVAGDMTYTIPAGYHNGSGTVTVTSDIEDALALI